MKMTKYKCSCCGKEYNKNQVTIECNCCYLNGICNELKKVLEEYLVNKKDTELAKTEPRKKPQIGELKDE